MPTQSSNGGWKCFIAGNQVASGSGPRQSIQHDIVKPAQRKRPPPPLLATPYKFTHRVTQNPTGKLVQRVKSSGLERSTYQGFLPLESGIAFPDMRTPSGWWGLTSAGADIESVAITKALNKLRSNGDEREGSFDPGVAWRERNELGTLYQDVVSRTVRGGDALLNLDYRRFSKLMGGNLSPRQVKRMFEDALGGVKKSTLRAPGALARGWLALKLAYEPLYRDLHGAAEHLAYRSEKHDWDILIGARAKRVEHHDAYTSPFSSFTWKTAKTHTVEQLTRSCTVSFTASVEDELDHKLAMLGLNNPIGVLYESTPLTFVADYAWDLGNWISALGAPFGCKFRTGSRTNYLEWIAENSQDPLDKESRWYGYARTCLWERKVDTNWPIPIAPFAVNPRGLNPSKIMTLASLALTRFTPPGGRGSDWSSQYPFRLTD